MMCYGKYRKMTIESRWVPVYWYRGGCCGGVAGETIMTIVIDRFGDNFFFIVYYFYCISFFANCNYNDVKLYLKLYLKIPSCYLLH